MNYFNLIMLIPLVFVTCGGDNSSDSINHSPVAVDDNVSAESVAITIDVMANDSDPDGDTISIVSVSIPAIGTALIVGGQVEYTPLADYLGADLFTYDIEDSSGAQATATVYVDVVLVPGSLSSWGADIESQVEDAPTGNDFIQVSAGYEHSVALKSDGSLVSWGSDHDSEVANTPTGNDFTQVSAGFARSVALRSDGSLVSWGSDSFLQVTNTPSSNGFTQVSAGDGDMSVALHADGSLSSWGDDFRSHVTNTPTGNDFTQVSAGNYHSVALKSDGSLVSWGLDNSLQVTNTPTGNDFIQVSAGGYYSVAIKF